MSKEQKAIRVNLDEKQTGMFEKIKTKLGLTQDSELVRYLIKKEFDGMEQIAEASP